MNNEYCTTCGSALVDGDCPNEPTSFVPMVIDYSRGSTKFTRLIKLAKELDMGIGELAVKLEAIGHPIESKPAAKVWQWAIDKLNT